VFHTRFSLRLILLDPRLVRIELLRVSFTENRHALLYPLLTPPQRADVHVHDGIDGVGIILDDLIMENLVGTDDFRLLLDLLLH
jgi:hypothetical protein